MCTCELLKGRIEAAEAIFGAGGPRTTKGWRSEGRRAGERGCAQGARGGGGGWYWWANQPASRERESEPTLFWVHWGTRRVRGCANVFHSLRPLAGIDWHHVTCLEDASTCRLVNEISRPATRSPPVSPFPTTPPCTHAPRPPLHGQLTGS